MNYERKYERKKEKLRKKYQAQWKKVQGYSRRDSITTTPVNEVLQSQNERLQENDNPNITKFDNLRTMNYVGEGMLYGATVGMIPLAILISGMNEPTILGLAVLFSSITTGALVGYRRGIKRT